MALPVATLGNLQLNHRDSSIIIIAAQILILDPLDTLREDRGADNSIGFRRPDQRRRDGVVQVDSAQPLVSNGPVAPGSDLVGQAGRPLLRILQGVAAHDLLWDAGVPNVVQVGVRAAEADVDAVAASIDVLCV